MVMLVELESNEGKNTNDNKMQTTTYLQQIGAMSHPTS